MLCLLKVNSNAIILIMNTSFNSDLLWVTIYKVDHWNGYQNDYALLFDLIQNGINRQKLKDFWYKMSNRINRPSLIYKNKFIGLCSDYFFFRNLKCEY